MKSIQLHCQCCYSFKKPELLDSIYNIETKETLMVCPDCKQYIIRKIYNKLVTANRNNCDICKQAETTQIVNFGNVYVGFCSVCFDEYVNKKIDFFSKIYLTNNL